MAKTSKDAARHMREWGEFFAGMKIASAAAVEEFLRRHAKRKYLKQSLRRLVAHGFVAEREGKLVVTKKGIPFFSRRAGSAPSRPVRWDGKWRLLAFDVPGGYNVKRDQIRAFLKEFDFYPLQKSVWICPAQASQRLWKLLVEHDLNRYCKAMVVEVIEGDRELQERFRGAFR